MQNLLHKYEIKFCNSMLTAHLIKCTSFYNKKNKKINFICLLISSLTDKNSQDILKHFILQLNIFRYISKSIYMC